MITIGEKIRALRKSKGMTTIELAKKVGVTNPSISQLETVKRIPSIEKLTKLASALGVPVGYFFDDGRPSPSPPDLEAIAARRETLKQLDRLKRVLTRQNKEVVAILAAIRESLRDKNGII